MYHSLQLHCNLNWIVATTLFASTAAAQIQIIPTTTFPNEAVNNTSASLSFAGFPNDVPKAANTSKSKTVTLLYSGSNTQMFAHFMGWFGGTGHQNVGYRSDDPVQVKRQVKDMKSRGLAGAILDWYGPATTGLSNSTAAVLRSEAEAQGFLFALTYDVGAVQGYAKGHVCDATQQTIDDLNYAWSTYETSSAYLRIDGRPVVFFFGLEAYYVNWNRVRANVAGNPLFIFRNRVGITDPTSDGGFAWQISNPVNQFDMSLSYLDDFYLAAKANPSRIGYGSGYPGFDDTMAGWTGPKVQHRQCGKTWVGSMKETAKFYSSSDPLNRLQVVTWNDYEEGTAIEPGIDNCLNIFAWMSGSTLAWKLTGTGDPGTVSYFRVFISLDGFNLMKLADVSGGARGLELSTLGLASGTTYTMYVKAMGRASIQNHISDPVAYRRGNQVPVISVTASPSSGIAPLAISVATTGSYDPDGWLAKGVIDFGDGTVVNGFSASHTYEKFDLYTLTVRLYDNRGATSAMQKTINAMPPRSGVIIWAPAATSTVNNTFKVVATASSSTGARIQMMKAYLDGSTAVYSVADDRMETVLKRIDGWHTLGVNAWDTNGVVYTSTLKFYTGLGTNYPPTPVVQIDDVEPAVGQQIRACTILSTDATGGIANTLVNFGDQTPLQNGITTYHSYAAPGNYTIMVTATDTRGMSASTTTSVFVH